MVIIKILNGLLMAYMLLISIRILLTWFKGPEIGKPYQILTAITDPYLNIFRRLKFLRLGRIDFSPIAAILILVIIMNIFNLLSLNAKLSFGIILAIIISVVWQTASFLLTFLTILIVIRIISVIFNFMPYSPIIQTLDSLIGPIITWMNKTFFKNRAIEYKISLSILGAVFLILVLIGNFAIDKLALMLINSPF